MTTNHGRSVAELRRESEHTRAELAQTVELLRERITETAAGVRQTVSPENIKAEVSSYVADKGRGWMEALKQQAMENPMQALAAGTALAVPVLRVAKGVPLPLLMIGAGLALTSPRVRRAVADKLTDATGISPQEAIDKAQDLAGQKLRSMSAAVEDAADQAAQAAQGVRDAVGGTAADAGQAATQLAGDVKDRVAAYGSTARDIVSEKLDAASEATGGALQAARGKSAEALGAARASAETVVRDNTGIVGAIGLAIGALLAASLPATRLEQKAMGGASDDLRAKVANAAEGTFEQVKSAVISAAEEAQSEIGEGVDRFADAAAGKLKTVTDEAVTTAFEPTHSAR
jgi:hypothetical protein